MRDPDGFEELYRSAPDPWAFATSTYEQGRYHRIVAALGRDHYRSAFEPACSIGALTELLAPRCDRLLAVDLSPTAAARAAERCADLPNVVIAAGSVMDVEASGHDLVVFSELGYYFERPDLDALVDRLVAALEPGGELVACHWRGASPDHRLHGDTVHEVLDAHPALHRRHHEVHDRYRLDGYTVSAGVSAGGRQ